MENRLEIHYITLLINCHLHTHGDNVLSNPTVNLDFRILQPKITKIEKIKQRKKKDGK